MCMRVLLCFLGGIHAKESDRLFFKGELLLWAASALLIVIAFAAFDRENCLTLRASLIGVTSLIFNAKGHPAG